MQGGGCRLNVARWESCFLLCPPYCLLLTSLLHCGPAIAAWLNADVSSSGRRVLIWTVAIVC